MKRTVVALCITAIVAGCGATEFGQGAVGAGQGAVTATGFADTPRGGIKARLRALLPGGSSGTGWATHPEADAWTLATAEALEEEGVALLSKAPADIMTYCPGYERASLTERKAFWVGLLSATARQASGLNPMLRAGKGTVKGLMAISDGAAKVHHCSGDLLDVGANMRCAVRVLADNVSRDGAIATPAPSSQTGQGQSWFGAAKSWIPFRKEKSRDSIAAFTRKQSYCGGK